MDITSKKNPKVLHLKKLGSSKEYREENREYLCDGHKLLEEAIVSGAVIHDVFCCEELSVELPENVNLYKVSYEIIKAISPLQTPQKVLFSVSMPEAREEKIPCGAIVLENIQDPGNVGTVIRTANALGISAVVLVGACADHYNPKCIRSTMGAIFREKVLVKAFADLKELKERGIPFYAAALGENYKEITDVRLRDAVVAIGNEGNGLTKDTLSVCDEKVIIPMVPGSESLNAAVAASVFMWEMAKANGNI